MAAKVAIIASEGSLLLEALLEAWPDSALAESRFFLVSPSASEQESVMFDGRPVTFEDIATFDFDQVQCAIVLVPSIVVEAYKEIILGAKCRILGFLDNLASVQPERFTGELEKNNHCFGVVQAPIAVMEYVLEGLECESLEATVLYPASFYGKQGVQELAAQTTRLLNAQVFESHLFGQQMPFNYFPMSANPLGAEIEQQIILELGMVFPDLDVHIKAIQMPVFYGLSLLVSVVLGKEVDIEGLKSNWLKKELISYQDSTKELSVMAVANQNGDIILGDLRKNATDNYRLDFWLGVDDVKFSVVHGLISAAEFLLKHHL